MEESVELLACVTSAGALDALGVVGDTRRISSSELTLENNRLTDLASFASLARALADRPASGGDYAVGVDLYEALRRLDIDRRTAEDADQLDAQTNIAAGRHDYVAKILPVLKIDADPRWMLDRPAESRDRMAGHETPGEHSMPVAAEKPAEMARQRWTTAGSSVAPFVSNSRRAVAARCPRSYSRWFCTMPTGRPCAVPRRDPPRA